MKVLFKNVTTSLAYTVVTCFNFASLIFLKKLLMKYDISILKQLADTVYPDRQQRHTQSRLKCLQQPTFLHAPQEKKRVNIT